MGSYTYQFRETSTITLDGFSIPNYATTPRPDNKSVDLESVPPEVLSTMCADWRAAVFEKAGKSDPGSFGWNRSSDAVTEDMLRSITRRNDMRLVWLGITIGGIGAAIIQVIVLLAGS